MHHTHGVAGSSPVVSIEKTAAQRFFLFGEMMAVLRAGPLDDAEADGTAGGRADVFRGSREGGCVIARAGEDAGSG